MINPARFGCAIYGAKDKDLEILKNLFKGMNSSDEECKFGLQG